MKYITQEEAQKLFTLIDLIEDKKVKTEETSPPWPYVWVKSISVEGDRFLKENVFKKSGKPPKPFQLDINYLSRDYITKNLI